MGLRPTLLALTAAACLAAAACTSSPGRSAAPSPPTASPTRGPVSGSTEWPQYHRTADRAGVGTSTPSGGSVRRAWAVTLDGQVYASPLAVGGLVVAATENDSLYGLDRSDGRVRWRAHVATPVPGDRLPCGNIDPLGITGTPVYDARTGLVFAVAETTGFQHVLVGVDVRTGAVRVRRPVDPPNQDPRPMQQRAALALLAGHVYVAYGGLNGDCGDYHGHVVGVRTDGTGSLSVYRVPTGREGGIWAASGPAATASGHLLVAVGNGESTSGRFDGTDSVVELSTPDLRVVGLFAPKTWPDDNANDLDLGSMGPALLPDGRILIAGKRGTAYLLRTGALRGVGTELSAKQVCRAFGGAAVSGRDVYLPCTDGVRLVQVGGDSSLSVRWHAAGAAGSPVIGGGRVWSVDPDKGDLVALDPATGHEVGRRHVGPVTRFATPALSGPLVLVGTEHGVVASTIS